MESIDESVMNREYEVFLSDSCLYDFLRTIKQNKPASKEENREMFLKYQNGDETIKKTIAEKNLALVVSIAQEIGRNLNSEEKLEYIQSGVIGLIEAIDSFDVSRGIAFSTYADYYIHMRINKYRYNNQRLIRRPENIELILGKYKKLIAEYDKSENPLPDRAEICSILNISEKTLKKVEEDYKLDALSYDVSIQDDDRDSIDLKDLLGSYDNQFNNLFDHLVIDEILKTLKIILSPYEYFIFYYRLFSSKKKTLGELCDYFGVTKSAIHVDVIKQKIQKMFDNNRTLKKQYLDKVKKNYSFNNIKITPCPIENYTMYFFLRDNFLEKDQIILKELLIGNLIFDSTRVSLEIRESVEYTEKKKFEIEKLIEKTINSIPYKLFHNEMIKKYHNKIYCLELNSDLREYLDIKRIIKDYWQEKNPNVARELAIAYNLPYDEEIMEIVRKFYGIAPKKNIKFDREDVERDINYNLYGFVIHELPLAKLYPFFLENQNKFTDMQRVFLNMYVFKKAKPKRELPSFYIYNAQSIINKLILLYYRITDYKKDNFDYKKYLSIRNQCMQEMSSDEFELIDFYYYIKQGNVTIKEMSILLGKNEDENEATFKRGKNMAISLYLGTTQYSFERDKEIYSRVLLDDCFILNSIHYEVAKMFFIEGKSYQEIASKKGLAQRRVSELIKYACQAMDYYRFGITSTQKKYSNDFLLAVLEKTKFDDETKNILKTYIDTKNSVMVSKILNKDVEEVRNIIRRFNILVNRAAIEQVEVTIEDITYAVLEHESTNILNERERIILSLAFGLKNRYNPSGQKKYPIDIAEIVGIKNNIGTAIRKAKEHVAAHKIGLLKTAIDFIDREELEDILSDQRLPITEDDKNIIIDAYGLYDAKYLTIAEVAKKYKITDQIVRKRLYQGIITIKKYLNREIEGNILFEVDIEPYLKYFTIDDREILILLYRDKLNQAEIAERYGLSPHQFTLLLQKIRMHLHDLRSGASSGIDFDYFWNNAFEDDLPFYGNKDLAIELCFLYYEKRINQSDIIKNYHPELSETTIGELIKSFTTAIIKYQHGIKKSNTFTYEEVSDYYERHENEMILSTIKQYKRYFEKVKRNGANTRTYPSRFIIFDLIKEKHPDYFRLKDATPEQIREILGLYGHTLYEKNVEILKSVYGVTHANLLTDEEWEKLINFFGTLQLIEKENKQLTKHQKHPMDSRNIKKQEKHLIKK